jgi:transcriptional regulator with XRE-family HTH domain
MRDRRPNDRLRQERQARWWSLRRVAVELHLRFPGVAVTEKEVGHWERGLRVPGPYYREKLCAIYHKRADELGFIEAVPVLAEAQLPEPQIIIATPEQAAVLARLLRGERA